MKHTFITFILLSLCIFTYAQKKIAREYIEWSDIWIPGANKTDLPHVLLIGNSITRGYYGKVEAALKEKAYVGRLSNSKSVGDPALIEELTVVLKNTKFDVIHFNNGLHGFDYTEEEYDKYAGVYKNALEEIKLAEAEDDSDKEHQEDDTVDLDYELMAYSSTKIDYEYIINLIQNIVTPSEEAEVITPEERQKQIEEVKQYVEEMQKDNPKVAEIMLQLINEIAQDENKYKGQSILNIVENMKLDCINKVISDFCVTWYASKDDVMYAALHYRNGEIPNESVIKATIDYQSYKDVHEKALPKFRYYTQCMAELRKTLDEEIKPLLTIAG